MPIKPEKKRDKKTSWILWLVAVLSLIIIFIAGAQIGGTIGQLIIVFIGVPVFVLLSHRAKQYRARSKAQEIIESDRTPVLYLRPFSREFEWEVDLANAVKPIGPMIALGKPEEKLPHLGAARAYSEYDKWQDLIKSWLSKAKLVILCPGDTDGLWWEMEQIYATIQPTKFLILITERDPEYYKHFIKKLREDLNIVLPDLEIRKILANRGGGAVTMGFYEFQENWQSRFLPLK